MQNIFSLIDYISGIETENNFARWLERIAFIFLFLMVLSAPHSIAATQISWLSGMLAWVVRLFVKPRPKLVRTPLDTALWAFFGWTVITSFFSYAPDISLGKLRGAALFLIFYFVINNLRQLRTAKILAFALIFSCMVSVAWSPIERIIGRGVEVSGIKAESLFSKANQFDHETYIKSGVSKLETKDVSSAGIEKDNYTVLVEGDTILKANEKKVRNPDDIAAEIGKNEITYLECFRTPNIFVIVVKRENLLNGESSLEKLGISDWKLGRNWRYAGFYGQIITYAEVLQLITSLVFGLLIAGLTLKAEDENFQSINKIRKSRLILSICFIGMLIALALTFTRAAQLALLVSALAAVFANGNRRLIKASLIIILPLALIGLFVLKQSRQVGFYDTTDDSVIYRQTIYREGFNLWTSNPRRFFLGVGMDSTKRFAGEWQLFDNGKLPPGHFHSTPLQLLVERGFPALLLWLWGLWIYAKTLWHSRRCGDWQTRGIILGCFGGLAGFFTSSLVNYSIGDSEVAMVFYLLIGLGLYCSNQKSPNLMSQTEE